MQEYSYIHGVLPDFEYSKVKVCTQHRHENYCYVTGTSRSALVPSPLDVSDAGHSLIMPIDDQYLSLSVTSPSPFLRSIYLNVWNMCENNVLVTTKECFFWEGVGGLLTGVGGVVVVGSVGGYGVTMRWHLDT